MPMLMVWCTSREQRQSDNNQHQAHFNRIVLTVFSTFDDRVHRGVGLQHTTLAHLVVAHTCVGDDHERALHAVNTRSD
jgi:hypothetical protein